MEEEYVNDNPPENVFVFVNVLAVYVFGMVVEAWMKEFTFVSPYEFCVRHVPLIA